MTARDKRITNLEAAISSKKSLGLASLSGPLSDKQQENLIELYRSEIPHCKIMEDIYIYLDHEHADHWRDWCRCLAITILSQWRSGHRIQLTMDNGEIPKLRWFSGHVIGKSEFESCTAWVHHHLSEIPLQEVCQAALEHVLRTPHRIDFYLEDFGLESEAGRVRSTPGIEYPYTAEDYLQMSEFRQQVEEDPEQQRIKRLTQETRQAACRGFARSPALI